MIEFIVWFGDAWTSTDIVANEANMVSAILAMAWMRTVRISLLLAGLWVIRDNCWWPQMLSIKAVAVIVNPVRVPAIVATVLYMTWRSSWVPE